MFAIMFMLVLCLRLVSLLLTQPKLERSKQYFLVTLDLVHLSFS
jgi:hypothetical protein